MQEGQSLTLKLADTATGEEVESQEVQYQEGLLAPVERDLLSILKQERATFQNLLKNGSFESALVAPPLPDGWEVSDPSTISLDGSERKFGEYSLSAANGVSVQIFSADCRCTGTPRDESNVWSLGQGASGGGGYSYFKGSAGNFSGSSCGSGEMIYLVIPNQCCISP